MDNVLFVNFASARPSAPSVSAPASATVIALPTATQVNRPVPETLALRGALALSDDLEATLVDMRRNVDALARQSAELRAGTVRSAELATSVSRGADDFAGAIDRLGVALMAALDDLRNNAGLGRTA